MTVYPTRKRIWAEQFLRKKSNTLQDTAIFKNSGKAYLDPYVSLALLELHIQGKIPAWEGILLV
ncbi:MAG TPA: hypothetical protein VHV10_11050 [Ktedonobacteraceae bacterium]|nr:hypothetical protein [Ktedonobacteraceae bacterium]